MNYIVRLGWSHGDQEIFSVDEMINLFELKNINKSPASFNQEKLDWINQSYIKTTEINELLSELEWHLNQQHAKCLHLQIPTFLQFLQNYSIQLMI